MRPLDFLRPFAEALIVTYYRMADRSADSQTSATWTADHFLSRFIPRDYVAVLRLTLRYKFDKDAESDFLQSEREQDTPAGELG